MIHTAQAAAEVAAELVRSGAALAPRRSSASVRFHVLIPPGDSWADSFKAICRGVETTGTATLLSACQCQLIKSPSRRVQSRSTGDDYFS